MDKSTGCDVWMMGVALGLKAYHFVAYESLYECQQQALKPGKVGSGLADDRQFIGALLTQLGPMLTVGSGREARVGCRAGS